jgi:hypothetical protein
MHVVDQIFAAFGNSPKAIADATGIPIQTVCDWRKKGQKEIPIWRRGAVLVAARTKPLSTEALEYLRSDRKAADDAAPESAAA